MQAVILAAGIGSRLRPLTNYKPKTLVHVNGKPIIEFIIDALVLNKINNIIICTGYNSDKIINFCKQNYPNVDFEFVHNKDYDITNNMYSLYLAKNFINDDFILMNADLAIESSIVTGMLSEEGNLVGAKKGKFIEESMKIIVNDGVIKSISKKINKDNAYGTSIDIYKIQKQDKKIIEEELLRIIEREKDFNQWTEVMLDNLFKSGKLIARPYDIGEKKWFEIDDFYDLNQAEIMFNNCIRKLSDRKVYFLDIDGTLMVGDKLLEGVRGFIAKLLEKNKKFYIITNNSSKTPTQYVNKFKDLEVDISEKNIISSIDTALTYLKKKSIKSIYFIANKRVSSYILDRGFSYDENNPQAVLLTYDDEINYDKIKKTCRFINLGIPYYATHMDMVCPTENGFIPDIGTFIKVIELTTGIIPNKLFGKPEEICIESCLEKLDIKPEESVLVGDRLYTDIKLAEKMALTSILVLSGETKRENYETSDIKADIVVEGVKQLIDFI